MSTPNFTVGRIGYTSNKPKRFWQKEIKHYHFSGEGYVGNSPTPEGLGRSILSAAIKMDNFQTPNLTSPSAIKLDGLQRIISGIPLDAEELRKVINSYESERIKYYNRRDLELKSAQEERTKLKMEAQ